MSDDVLGTVSFIKKGVNEISLRCNLVAYLPYHESLKAIGVAGPAQSVKAAVAMLHDANACAIRLRSIPGFRSSMDVTKDLGTKWAVSMSPIGPPGMRLVHAVAWDNSDDFLLLDDSEESLWGVLRSERFTTPVLREWMPWIREQLIQRVALRLMSRWNCRVSQLVCSTKGLDGVVSQGVASGELVIPEAVASLV